MDMHIILWEAYWHIGAIKITSNTVTAWPHWLISLSAIEMKEVHNKLHEEIDFFLFFFINILHVLPSCFCNIVPVNI